ncbi:MAG TPA: glycosyltransferase family 2 protein [Acidimicrobiia bacterium]|nr:glycosyltransferase family 2 protein [Acidimicrobiia bacterium]
MSDHPDTGLPSTAPEQRVRVAVLAVDDDGLVGSLAAIDRQVYGIDGLSIIDADEAITDPDGRAVVADFATFVEELGPEIDLVWIVHGDARPRPDALGALVAELGRNEAALVGSKIIDAATTDRLESVGSATDVFGEPYTGLDPDEVDLEQYDVVRDVAFVSAVSMLVRRDLLRGMRGIDAQLAPVAAGMDFSQRVRVAGGRVMVAPSSEVLHERTCREEVAGWREWAGRMRSMLKAYRMVTLAWVVPVGTLLGFLDGIVRLFLGSPRTLVDFFKALGWNVAHLPGSLAARSTVRAVRHVGDEELFRYQVAGSVRLRTLVNDVSERFGWVIDDEPGVLDEDELDDDSTAAGPIVAALGLVAVALATRGFWVGTMPQVGFSLPVLDPLVALDGFAGGWNPSGLGSSEPIHPSAAFFGAVEWASAQWGGASRLVMALLLVGAFFAAGRLLREMGVTGPTRHLAGIAALLGTATGAFATEADLAGWLAIGPTLGAVTLAIMPWPASWVPRIGRISAIVAVSLVAGMLAPGAALVILATPALAWALVPGVRVGAAGRGLVAADVALFAAAPYLAAVTADELTERGPAYSLTPDFLAIVLIAVAVACGIGCLAGRRHRVVALGGLLVAGAMWFPLLEQPRGDLGAAFALLMAVGVTLVVGAVVGIDREGSKAILMGRAAGSLAAVALVVVALAHVVDGRAGFPADEWTGRLDFTSSLASEEESARVLVVGDGSRLPGEYRTEGSVRYRVLPLGGPSLETARLGEPRLGDEALADVVASIAGGELVRPGQVLAEFGIGWVAVIDAPAFTAAMGAQVDMDELPVSEGLTVFRNGHPAVRAATDTGVIWRSDGGRFVGPAGAGTVRIADNASPRWGPGWEQDGWANRVSASEGVASYEPHSVRRGLAWAVVAVGAIGLVGTAFVRREGR